MSSLGPNQEPDSTRTTLESTDSPAAASQTTARKGGGRSTQNSKAVNLVTEEEAAEAVKSKRKGRKVTIEEADDLDATSQQRAARPSRASEAGKARANSEASGTEGAEPQRQQSGLGQPRYGTHATTLKAAYRTVTSDASGHTARSSARASLAALAKEKMAKLITSEAPIFTRDLTPTPDVYNIFDGLGVPTTTKVFEMPLDYAVERFHVVYNPIVDADPLIEFGMVNGQLPGHDAEDARLLRNIIFRWTLPHSDFLWDNLPEAVERVSSLKFSKDQLQPVERNDGQYYAMYPSKINMIGDVVVAINQVLRGLHEFRRDSSAVVYTLDPGYAFLKILALNDAWDEMLVAIEVLQERMKRAVKRVNGMFNDIRKSILTFDEAASVSSYNSTDTNLRTYLDDPERSPLSVVVNTAFRDDFEPLISADYKDAMRRMQDRRRTLGRGEVGSNLFERQPPTLRKLAPERIRSARQEYYEGVEKGVINPSRGFAAVESVSAFYAHPPDRTQPPAESISAHLSQSRSQGIPPARSDNGSDGSSRSKGVPASISRAQASSQIVSALPGMGRFPSSQAIAVTSTNGLGLRMGNPTTGQSGNGNGGPSATSQIPTRSILSRAAVPATSALGTTTQSGTWTSYQFQNRNASEPIAAGGTGGNNTPTPDPPSANHGARLTFPTGGGGGGGSGGGGGPGGNGGFGGAGRYDRAPGGGRDGDGGGGGGGPGNGPGGHAWPAPDAQQLAGWQMNPKLNLTSLPSWDGEGTSIIDYLAEMSDFARLGDRMEADIAQLAAHRWTGKAKMWWQALGRDEQEYLSAHWNHMLLGLRTQFLDETWMSKRLQEFEEMKFRDFGHRKETPLEYFQRRIRHHSILYPNEPDGPAVVTRLLRNQPVEWGAMLNSDSCPSTLELQRAASRLALALEGQYSLCEHLRNSQSISSAHSASSFKGNHFRKKAAHVTEREVEEEEYATAPEDSEEEDIVKDAHLANNSFNRAKGSKPRKRIEFPAGQTVNGHSFARDDSVKSARTPKGTCFICTSPNHFYRDCSHFGKFDAMRNANMIHVDWDPDLEKAQDREYIAMIVESKASATLSAYDMSETPSTSDYEKPIAGMCALHLSARVRPNRNTRRRQLFESKDNVRRAEALKNPPMPRIPRTIRRRGYRTREQVRTAFTAERVDPTNAESEKDSQPMGTSANSEAKEEQAREEMKELPIYAAKKGRSLPEGLGSLGSRALQITGRLLSLEERDVDIRLDSGADITLMLEDFYNSIPGLPRIKEGLRMKLYHLTGHAKVLGYVRTELFASATDGTIIKFELEAYVVRNMRVPLLIGEDFQTTYELGLRRHATGACEVLVGQDAAKIIPATSSLSVDLGFEIRQAHTAQSFVRAKTVRRARAKEHRNKEDSAVYAVEDVLINPGTVHLVKVTTNTADIMYHIWGPA